MFTRFQHFIALQLLISIVTVAEAFFPSLTYLIAFRYELHKHCNFLLPASLYPPPRSPRFLFPSCIHQHLPPFAVSLLHLFLFFFISFLLPNANLLSVLFLPANPQNTNRFLCYRINITIIINKILLLFTDFVLYMVTTQFRRCANCINTVAFYFIYKILKLWKI